jgi:hypothetical protein
MIKITNDLHNLKIYISDLLHFSLLLSEYIGMQSWIAGTKKKRYYIEFYLKEGESITLEYEKQELWKSILVELDKNL